MILNAHLCQLRYFANLASSRTFSEAAKRSFITQPALSQSVRALERELKVQLLERPARGVRLSRAGRRFLERCLRVLEEMETGSGVLAADGEAPAGRVSIGMPPSLGYYGVLDFLARFRAAHPGIEVLHCVQGVDDVEDRIDTGDLDFGLTYGRPARPSLEAEPLVWGDWGVFCRKDHPLAGRRTVSAAQLEPHPLLAHQMRLEGEDFLESWMRNKGLSPSVFLRTDDLEANRRLLLEGRGVARLPLWMLRRELREGAVFELKLQGFKFRSRIRLVRRKGRAVSEAKELFIGALRKGLRLACSGQDL